MTLPFPWRTYLVAAALILLLTLAPVISVTLVSLIASLADCRVHEGFVQPCVVFGADIGGMLYFMGVMGWLMLVTLPAGAIALAGWVVMLGVHWLYWRRNRNPQ